MPTNKQSSNKRTILMLALFCALYFLLSFPFHPLRVYEDLISVRLCGFIPMTAGLLYGPVGAVVCAIGNFLVDCAQWPLEPVDLYGTLGVFLMGWLPYKLWHTIYFGKDHSIAFLGNASSVLKFGFVAFVSSCAAAGFTAASGELLGVLEFAGFFQEVCLQYFVLTILIGLPLFQILTFKLHVDPVLPRNASGRWHATFSVLDIVLGFTICIMAWVMFLLQIGATVNSPAPETVCGVFVFLVCVLAAVPVVSASKLSESKEYKRPAGLEAEFILGFSLLLTAFLTFYILSFVRRLHLDVQDRTFVWFYALNNAAVAAGVCLVVLSWMLSVVEKRVTKPILAVTRYADDFVEGDKLRQDDLPDPHVGNEIDRLTSSVSDMANDVRHYVVQERELAAREEREKAELSAAREIQMSILPDGNAGDEVVEVSGFMRAARSVGGDLYDYYDFGDGRWFFAVGDVSGKGITAALVMMRAKTLMQQSIHLPLEQLMAAVNDEIAQRNDSMMFVTIFAGIYNEKTHMLSYVNAGHNPPIIWNDGTPSYIDSQPDIAVGPIEGITYTEHTMQMGTDFGVLVYSDGVTEAQNSDEAFFGEDRLMKAAEEASGLGSEDTVREIRSVLDAFVGDAEQADDITLLCLRAKTKQ